MPTFRRKPLPIAHIEAEQFLPPNKIPTGVFNVYGNGFSFIGEIWTIQGERVTVRPGEWIVQELRNKKRYYPIENQTFLDLYEEVKEDKE